MTKATMPRAVGYVSRDPSQADMDPDLPEGTALITAAQAEAYAASRVREALEEAIDQVAFYGGSIEIEAAIRALISGDEYQNDVQAAAGGLTQTPLEY